MNRKMGKKYHIDRRTIKAIFLLVQTLIIPLFFNGLNNFQGYNNSSTNLNDRNVNSTSNSITNTDLKQITKDNNIPPGLFPSDMNISNENLIDGVKTENISGFATPEQNISLNLNQSAQTIGATVNITGINETRNYIQNGNFDSNTSDWNVTNETDVNNYWESSFLGESGVSKLNLTGIEQQHQYSKYSGNNGIDKINSVENWKFGNDSGINYIANFTALTGNIGSSNGCLELNWGYNLGAPNPEIGSREGWAYSNFTYNGTDNLKSANLSFYYDMQFGSEYGYGNVNISVFITTPKGTEYHIGDWTQNFATNNAKNVSETGWTLKQFSLSDLKGIIQTPGNYTLKFLAQHYHHPDGTSFSGVTSRILIDDVKLTVNYTRKDFSSGNQAYFENSFQFGKLPLNDSHLDLSYAITTPFSQLNSSGAQIFLNVNNYTIYNSTINETAVNNWINLNFNVNNSITNSSSIIIQFGIKFAGVDTVSFYPNDSWSIYLDNVSFYIKSSPKPDQIQLQIYNPNLNRTYQVINGNYGRGMSLILNGSVNWLGNNGSLPNSPFLPSQDVIIRFLTNSTNVTISYNIVKYELTWRDTLYLEFSEITNTLDDYLENCENAILDPELPIGTIADFINILNYSEQGNFGLAEKYSSLISPQFPFLFNGLLSTLNGTFYADQYNQYNPDANIQYFNQNNPIDVLSMGNFKNMQSLFQQIWSLYSGFNNYGFSDNVIRNEYRQLYENYILLNNNTLSDIKSKLSDIQINMGDNSTLNLSAMYLSLQNMLASMENVNAGLANIFSIDPMNSLENWGCSETYNTLINNNSFFGIFLGNLPTLAEICSKFNDITVNDSKECSWFYEYLSSSVDSDNSPQSSVLPVSNNPFGLFGVLPSENSQSASMNASELTNKFIPASPQDLTDYLLLTIIIEDFIIRQNSPLVLDYAYKSVLSILEKTTGGIVNNNQFTQTQYNGSVNFNNPNFIDNNSNNLSNITIFNSGNSSSVSLIQRYYLPTSVGLILINQQYIRLSDYLNRNGELSISVPIQCCDSLLSKSIYGTIFGFQNVSTQYILEQEVYFGHELIAKKSDMMVNIAQTVGITDSNIVNISNTLKGNSFDVKQSFILPNNNASVPLNISKLLYSQGITFDDVKNNLITIIVSSSSNYGGLGKFSLMGEFNGKKIGYNFNTGEFFNNISSINSEILPTTKYEQISFNIKDLLANTGLINNGSLPTKNDFEKVIFNITALNSNYLIPLNIQILCEKSVPFLPIFFDNLDYKLSVTDYDNKIFLNIPFAEISGNLYYTISNVSLSLNSHDYYESYNPYFVPYSIISGQYSNIFLTVYPRSMENGSESIINVNYSITLFNGTQIEKTTQLHVEFYAFYRFKPPISSNVFLILLFGALIVVSSLFLQRIFQSNYISLHYSNGFDGSKKLSKKHRSEREFDF